MALLVYWYDFICFAIVAAAVSGSLWVLHGSEHRRRPRQESVYESLVIIDRGDGDQMRHSQLWMSCWAGLHPFWLLAFRSVSAVSMAVMLWWDIYSYGFYIMLYYTEYALSPHL